MGVLRQSRRGAERGRRLRREAAAGRDTALVFWIQSHNVFLPQASLSSQSRALSHGLPGALWLVSMTSSKLSRPLPTKRSTELDIAPACSPARASADPKSALLTRQRPTLSCAAPGPEQKGPQACGGGLRRAPGLAEEGELLTRKRPQHDRRHLCTPRLSDST